MRLPPNHHFHRLSSSLLSLSSFLQMPSFVDASLLVLCPHYRPQFRLDHPKHNRVLAGERRG